MICALANGGRTATSNDNATNWYIYCRSNQQLAHIVTLVVPTFGSLDRIRCGSDYCLFSTGNRAENQVGHQSEAKIRRTHFLAP